MDLYTRLLRHSEENSKGEVCLKIITTGKPNASYSVSRLDSSDIKKQEWLKHNGVFDDLKINLTGDIHSPPLLEGINYSINISSPEPSEPIKYKSESALGRGCKSGENGLRFDIRLNRNIVKNIIDTLVWKDTLFWVNKFQDNMVNDENEIGTGFTLIINNIKKFEDESELDYQIGFTVESLDF